MMDFWADQMQRMTQNAVPEGYEQPFQEWMKLQREFMKTMTAGFTFNDWMNDAPKQLSNWMELQQEMSKQWLDTMRKTAEEMGATLPDFHQFKNSGNSMGDWMTNWRKWDEEKDPAAWYPFFNQYMEVYQMLFRYWEPFREMIQDGVYDEEVLDKFFSKDAYRRLTAKMFNFGTPDRMSEWLERGNELLEHYMEYVNDVAPTLENTMAVWDKLLEKYSPKGVNPMFNVLVDINRYLREILDPFYAIAGPDKEIRMWQLMRDVQFNYLSFHVKAAELQGMIAEAGNLALPDAIREMTETFKSSDQQPQFRDFFRVFIDKLEARISEVLASEPYSKLQGEVAKTGVTVKSRLDEMVEWSLRGLPIVTKSEEDSIAQEMHALREKVRHLEKELGELKLALKEKAVIAASS